MTLEQVAKAREMLRKREPFGRIYAATSISSEQLFALLYGLRDMSDADAAEYWQRNLASLTTCEALHQHFKARAYPSVEANQFEQIAALVVRLRNELEHTNQHLVAHIDALTKSNAQCGEYLRRNEQLHSELVDVRAALAATTEQRDSLRRTLDEWERADTKPHARIDEVAAAVPVCMQCLKQRIETEHDYDTGPSVAFLTKPLLPADVADHVAPPVLPLCNVCHECGSELANCSQGTNHHDCPRPLCPRTCTGRHGGGFSPYSGPCKSATPVRHE